MKLRERLTLAEEIVANTIVFLDTLVEWFEQEVKNGAKNVTRDDMDLVTTFKAIVKFKAFEAFCVPEDEEKGSEVAPDPIPVGYD